MLKARLWCRAILTMLLRWFPAHHLPIAKLNRARFAILKTPEVVKSGWQLRFGVKITASRGRYDTSAATSRNLNQPASRINVQHEPWLVVHWKQRTCPKINNLASKLKIAGLNRGSTEEQRFRCKDQVGDIVDFAVVSRW